MKSVYILLLGLVALSEIQNYDTYTKSSEENSDKKEERLFDTSDSPRFRNNSEVLIQASATSSVTVRLSTHDDSKMSFLNKNDSFSNSSRVQLPIALKSVSSNDEFTNSCILTHGTVCIIEECRTVHSLFSTTNHSSKNVCSPITCTNSLCRFCCNIPRNGSDAFPQAPLSYKKLWRPSQRVLSEVSVPKSDNKCQSIYRNDPPNDKLKNISFNSGLYGNARKVVANPLIKKGNYMNSETRLAHDIVNFDGQRLDSFILLNCVRIETLEPRLHFDLRSRLLLEPAVKDSHKKPLNPSIPSKRGNDFTSFPISKPLAATKFDATSTNGQSWSSATSELYLSLTYLSTEQLRLFMTSQDSQGSTRSLSNSGTSLSSITSVTSVSSEPPMAETSQSRNSFSTSYASLSSSSITSPRSSLPSSSTASSRSSLSSSDIASSPSSSLLITSSASSHTSSKLVSVSASSSSSSLSRKSGSSRVITSSSSKRVSTGTSFSSQNSTVSSHVFQTSLSSTTSKMKISSVSTKSVSLVILLNSSSISISISPSKASHSLLVKISTFGSTSESSSALSLYSRQSAMISRGDYSSTVMSNNASASKSHSTLRQTLSSSSLSLIVISVSSLASIPPSPSVSLNFTSLMKSSQTLDSKSSKLSSASFSSFSNSTANSLPKSLGTLGTKSSTYPPSKFASLTTSSGQVSTNFVSLASFSYGKNSFSQSTLRGLSLTHLSSTTLISSLQLASSSTNSKSISLSSSTIRISKYTSLVSYDVNSPHPNVSSPSGASSISMTITKASITKRSSSLSSSGKIVSSSSSISLVSSSSVKSAKLPKTLASKSYLYLISSVSSATKPVISISTKSSIKVSLKSRGAFNLVSKPKASSTLAILVVSGSLLTMSSNSTLISKGTTHSFIFPKTQAARSISKTVNSPQNSVKLVSIRSNSSLTQMKSIGIITPIIISSRSPKTIHSSKIFSPSSTVLTGANGLNTNQSQTRSSIMPLSSNSQASVLSKAAEISQGVSTSLEITATFVSLSSSKVSTKSLTNSVILSSTTSFVLLNSTASNFKPSSPSTQQSSHSSVLKLSSNSSAPTSSFLRTDLTISISQELPTTTNRTQSISTYSKLSQGSWSLRPSQASLKSLFFTSTTRYIYNDLKISSANLKGFESKSLATVVSYKSNLKISSSVLNVKLLVDSLYSLNRNSVSRPSRSVSSASSFSPAKNSSGSLISDSKVILLTLSKTLISKSPKLNVTTVTTLNISHISAYSSNTSSMSGIVPSSSYAPIQSKAAYSSGNLSPRVTLRQSILTNNSSNIVSSASSVLNSTASSSPSFFVTRSFLRTSTSSPVSSDRAFSSLANLSLLGTSFKNSKISTSSNSNVDSNPIILTSRLKSSLALMVSSSGNQTSLRSIRITSISSISLSINRSITRANSSNIPSVTVPVTLNSIPISSRLPAASKSNSNSPKLRVISKLSKSSFESRISNPTRSIATINSSSGTYNASSSVTLSQSNKPFTGNTTSEKTLILQVTSVSSTSDFSLVSGTGSQSSSFVNNSNSSTLSHEGQSSDVAIKIFPASVSFSISNSTGTTNEALNNYISQSYLSKYLYVSKLNQTLVISPSRGSWTSREGVPTTILSESIPLVNSIPLNSETNTSIHSEGQQTIQVDVQSYSSINQSQKDSSNNASGSILSASATNGLYTIFDTSSQLLGSFNISLTRSETFILTGSASVTPSSYVILSDNLSASTEASMNSNTSITYFLTNSIPVPVQTRQLHESDNNSMPTASLSFSMSQAGIISSLNISSILSNVPTSSINDSSNTSLINASLRSVPTPNPETQLNGTVSVSIANVISSEAFTSEANSFLTSRISSMETPSFNSSDTTKKSSITSLLPSFNGGFAPKGRFIVPTVIAPTKSISRTENSTHDGQISYVLSSDDSSSVLDYNGATSLADSIPSQSALTNLLQYSSSDSTSQSILITSISTELSLPSAGIPSTELFTNKTRGSFTDPFVSYTQPDFTSSGIGISSGSASGLLQTSGITNTDSISKNLSVSSMLSPFSSANVHVTALENYTSSASELKIDSNQANQTPTRVISYLSSSIETDTNAATSLLSTLSHVSISVLISSGDSSSDIPKSNSGYLASTDSSFIASVNTDTKNSSLTGPTNDQNFSFIFTSETSLEFLSSATSNVADFSTKTFLGVSSVLTSSFQASPALSQPPTRATVTSDSTILTLISSTSDSYSLSFGLSNSLYAQSINENLTQNVTTSLLTTLYANDKTPNFMPQGPNNKPPSKSENLRVLTAQSVASYLSLIIENTSSVIDFGRENKTSARSTSSLLNLSSNADPFASVSNFFKVPKIFNSRVTISEATVTYNSLSILSDASSSNSNPDLSSQDTSNASINYVSNSRDTGAQFTGSFSWELISKTNSVPILSTNNPTVANDQHFISSSTMLSSDSSTKSGISLDSYVVISKNIDSNLSTSQKLTHENMPMPSSMSIDPTEASVNPVLVDNTSTASYLEISSKAIASKTYADPILQNSKTQSLQLSETTFIESISNSYYGGVDNNHSTMISGSKLDIAIAKSISVAPAENVKIRPAKGITGSSSPVNVNPVSTYVASSKTYDALESKSTSFPMSNSHLTNSEYSGSGSNDVNKQPTSTLRSAAIVMSEQDIVLLRSTGTISDALNLGMPFATITSKSFIFTEIRLSYNSSCTSHASSTSLPQAQVSSFISSVSNTRNEKTSEEGYELQEKSVDTIDSDAKLLRTTVVGVMTAVESLPELVPSSKSEPLGASRDLEKNTPSRYETTGTLFFISQALDSTSLQDGIKDTQSENVIVPSTLSVISSLQLYYVSTTDNETTSPSTTEYSQLFLEDNAGASSNRFFKRPKNTFSRRPHQIAMSSSGASKSKSVSDVKSTTEHLVVSHYKSASSLFEIAEKYSDKLNASEVNTIKGNFSWTSSKFLEDRLSIESILAKTLIYTPASQIVRSTSLIGQLHRSIDAVNLGNRVSLAFTALLSLLVFML